MTFSPWVINCLLIFNLLAHGSTSTTHSLRRRDHALITSPSGNYAPVYTECPDNIFLRNPNELEDGQTKLSSAEDNYIKEKSSKSIPQWQQYLLLAGLKDFNIDQFLKPAKSRGGLAGETLPNLGLALSGGGGRALCLSGSILEAFDSRNPKAIDAKVGGILQLSNYAVGISGSTWLLGAWATSNFPPISSLTPQWRLSEQNDLWDWNVAKHYRKVIKVIKKKKKAGFPTNIVDFWGRLLSRLFIDDPTQKDPNQGEAVLWSSIRETSQYRNREVPYVMALTTSRPGTKQDFTHNSPIYEFSAEEFGVFHPRLNVSIPMEYLGSPLSLNGKRGTCVRGYDNAGFIMGMSSNIYSMIDSPEKKKPFVLKIVDKFTDDDDFEGKVPNTFQNLGQTPSDGSPGFQDNERTEIFMADCGFITENIPIYPLIQPERKIDVIMVVDASTDAQSEDPDSIRYPNGTALFASYSKLQMPIYRGYHMPKIPSSVDGTFTKLGYHQRPTFFGCDDFQGPLIIYLPNYYAVGKTNVSTYKTTYTPEEIENFFANGFAIATQSAGPTANPDWPACLACALIDRQVMRNSGSRTDQCRACFKTYCAIN